MNFKVTRRQAIDLSQVSLVKSEYLSPEHTMPLVIQPALAGVNLASWARNNLDFLETSLQKHGAVLFRGFEIDTPAKFEEFASTIYPELFGEYGDLPREDAGDKIYGSTPYPSDQAILFHNESSHLHRWPMKIWFCCMVAAKERGETPIVDCRKMYTELDPEIIEKFERKQLMYVRNFIEGLDVSWQQFFHTDDKAKVEEYCRAASISYEWKSDRHLTTRRICHAVTKHPKTGEAIFFNQLQLHHVSCLNPAVRSSLLSMFGEEALPRNVYYGDGSPIEDEVMARIGDLYERLAVRFPWQASDIMMLDNMLVAHARDPYVGPRKILVAMADIFSYADLA